MTTGASEEIQAVDPATLAIPDTMREGDYIQTAGEDFTKVSQLRTGYIPVWDTKTGQLGYTTHYLRHTTARITHPDGTPMYTFRDPQIPQVIGQELPCPLNPASKDHHLVEGMNFPVCRKMKMPNQAAVNAHVSKSHKRAYAAMAEARSEKLQRETIESNRELVAGIVNAMGGGNNAPENKSGKLV
jgi:hypothetical protein